MKYCFGFGTATFFPFISIITIRIRISILTCLQVPCIRHCAFFQPLSHNNHPVPVHTFIVRLSSLHTKHHTIYLYVYFYTQYTPGRQYSSSIVKYSHALLPIACSPYLSLSLFLLLLFLWQHDDLRIVAKIHTYWICVRALDHLALVLLLLLDLFSFDFVFFLLVLLFLPILFFRSHSIVHLVHPRSSSQHEFAISFIHMVLFIICTLSLFTYKLYAIWNILHIFSP